MYIRLYRGNKMLNMDKNGILGPHKGRTKNKLVK